MKVNIVIFKWDGIIIIITDMYYSDIKITVLQHDRISNKVRLKFEFKFEKVEFKKMVLFQMI